MAAVSGNISSASTIVWKTMKADRYRCRISSEFSLMGETWHLIMDSGVEQYDFNEKCHNDGCCAIYLMRRVKERTPPPFSVTTYVETDASKDGRPARCLMTTCVPESCRLIWSYKEEFISKQIAGFRDRSELTVVCVFRDIESPDQPDLQIEDETIDVTAHTYFEDKADISAAKILPDDECDQAASRLSSNLDSLSQDFGKLLQDGVLPDVNLRCGDRKIAAHKAVLAARSEVFSAMFQSEMSENETGVVDIIDIDAEVLEWFLKYVYAGRLTDLSDDSLPSLYAASDKYAVNALKRACSKRMIYILTKENCWNFLLLADAHVDQDFKNVIFDFILSHMEILKSHKWIEFSKENPTLSNEVLQMVVQQKCF